MLLLFSILGSSAFAQKAHSVKGIVVDNADNSTLTNATISILHAKDSTLVSFTRSTEKGTFSIDNLMKGDYLLLVSYPQYTDLIEPFRLDTLKPAIDFGSMKMLLVSNLLEDVVITGNNTIVIKGDTIEYDASRFSIQPNAKAEELLKQLPGIQVDAKGNITAQGRKVEKVLLDGEEFFGDDPTLITRNIRGDMVGKVQVYEKKSDQAAFTGIEDGQSKTTINIQLKEDAKKGHFGKVGAGKSLNTLYSGQGMLNVFDDQQKMAAYGTSGNTGQVGSGIGQGDELNSYSGQGFPLVHSGGAHYSSRWNDKKQSINANYKVGSLELDGYRNTLEENTLPTGIMNSTANQDYNNFLFRHKLDAVYEHAIDSTASLLINLEGQLKNDRTRDDFESAASNDKHQLLNKSQRSNSNEGHSNTIKASALWRKKLRKAGRTLSISLNQNNDQQDYAGFNASENEFYGSLGQLDSTVSIHQQKLTTTHNSVFSSTFAYTEALSKKVFLAFNYNFSLDQGRSRLLSYNPSLSGGHTNLDSLYSTDYTINQLINGVGASLYYGIGKSRLTLDLGISDVQLKQVDRFHDQTMDRRYTSISPVARWMYNPSPQKNIVTSYTVNNNQPTLDQLQPVRNNSNPLYLIIGNPDLKPSYSHQFSSSFNSFKMLSGTSLSLNISGGLTSNAIQNSVQTDAVGKTTSQFINLSSHLPIQYGGSLLYGTTIKKLDARINTHLGFSGNTAYNLINDELNKSQMNAIFSQVGLSKMKLGSYSVEANFGPSYERNSSTFQRGGNNVGWGLRGNLNAILFLPKGFEIGSNTTYTYAGATQVFDKAFERTLWNIDIKKKILKNESLILSAQLHDVLDQNRGFNRSAYNTTISQSSYSTIGRYALFSLLWEFNKMNGK